MQTESREKVYLFYAEVQAMLYKYNASKCRESSPGLCKGLACIMQI